MYIYIRVLAQINKTTKAKKENENKLHAVFICSPGKRVSDYFPGWKNITHQFPGKKEGTLLAGSKVFDANPGWQCHFVIYV